MLESMRDVGLRPLLADWGVVQGDDIVIDRTRTITGRELFITSYGSHPVTAGLQGTSSIMYLPCSLEPRAANQVGDEGADRPVVTVLATSSAMGWAESDWMRTPMEFDPASEKGGALSVAVAIERGLPDEAGVQVGATRMVVFGDSDFVSNAGLAGGNLDFFQGAVDWMLGREELIAIAPKVIGESRLALSRGQMLTLAAIVMLAMPALALLCALVVWLFRRS